jgi:hypothetical protein
MPAGANQNVPRPCVPAIFGVESQLLSFVSEPAVYITRDVSRSFIRWVFRDICRHQYLHGRTYPPWMHSRSVPLGQK